MVGVFDPKKALQEEISGLLEVSKVIQIQERRAEQDCAEAEARLNAARKLSGFAQVEIARKRNVLQQLIDQEKQQ